MWPAVWPGTSITVEAQAEDLDRVAVGQRGVRAGDAFALRTVHRTLQARAQRIDTADVIGVVVGH